jgi:tetratricopeptide (TPR) repeat protein
MTGAFDTKQVRQPELIGERYRVVRTIGRGGVASVYEAIDESTGRQVAVKQLHPHHAAGDGQMARLFEMEFHTLAQLAHPRVVEVYDYQKLAEGAYYTMELLEGEDLRQQRVLPWKEVCALLCDVCSALSLLHSRRFVHRDVTPRNIRRTRDGKAKLIDFGAMVPFGTHTRAVGTPSFTAPEVVMGQPLDGRTDLYSLGATAYYALTGRYAYSARTFDNLRNAWRSQPALPSHYVPEIPPDLDQLVMSLINVPPSRRPANAGAVIERLTAIAGLQLDEQLQVQHSFLSTPSLVGRDGVLQQVRRLMVQGARGGGASLFLTGPRGVGLSRMVDACALEGKLAGAVVLRADANDAEDSDWGGVRSLLEQLATELAAKGAELLIDSADVLAHVWPRATALTGVSPRAFAQSHEIRAAVQDSLLNLMEAVSRRSFLVVTADDVDRVDEPTRAFLALLAQQVRGCRIVVVAAAASDSLNTGIPELQLLCDDEATIELQPLLPADTERLLVSVFGEVPNVRLFASRLHDLSSGIPAVTMQLTQHLLDQEVIGFRDGGWLLPSAVAPDALPTSVSDVMRARIARVDGESVTLARAIALSQRSSVSLEECALLLGQSDLAAVLRPLDLLIGAQVLRVMGDRYSLSLPGWAPLLLAGVDPERKRALHARVAEMFVKMPNAAYSAAGHLLASDNPSAAIDLLLVHIKRQYGELAEDPSRLQELVRLLPSDWMNTLESAIAAADRLARPRRERLVLRIHLVQYLAVTARSRPAVVREVVNQLRADSGLRDYQALGDTVAPEERLGRALERAQQRYDATPEAERGMAPGEAIPVLTRVITHVVAMTGTSADIAFLKEMSSLGPFAVLSPAIALVHLNFQSSCHLLAGQWAQAHEGYTKVLALMAEPGGVGLEPAVHRYMELSVTYGVAFIEILVGLPAAAERIDILERDLLFEVTAWRLRMLRALQQGDIQTADRCERTSELLKIRNCPSQFFEGSDVWNETLAYTEIGDVARIRQTLERLEAMAAKFGNWVTGPMLAQGHILRLRGKPEAAAELFSKALSSPGTSELLSLAYIARAYLTALAECGRVQEARVYGAKILEDMRAAGRTVLLPWLYHAMALVERAGGDHDAALKYLQEAADIREHWPLAEVFGGACEELRARIAIDTRDQEAFQNAADQCATSFLASRNPTLIARHQRLLQDAERAGLRLPAYISQAPAQYGGDLVTLTVESATATAEAKPVRIEGSCLEERVARILSLAPKRGLGQNAMLYLIRDNVPTLVGQRGSCPEAKRMNKLVASYLRGEIEEPSSSAIDPDDFVTTTVDDSEWVGPTGTRFAPALLSHRSSDGLAISGVLVFDLEGQRRPEDSLLSDLSAALTVAADAVPLKAKLPVRKSDRATARGTK